MKEKIIDILISCDWWNHGVASCKEISPSSSIEEIAEYLAMEFEKDKNTVQKNIIRS